MALKVVAHHPLDDALPAVAGLCRDDPWPGSERPLLVAWCGSR